MRAVVCGVAASVEVEWSKNATTEPCLQPSHPDDVATPKKQFSVEIRRNAKSEYTKPSHYTYGDIYHSIDRDKLDECEK